MPHIAIMIAAYYLTTGNLIAFPLYILPLTHFMFYQMFHLLQLRSDLLML